MRSIGLDVGTRWAEVAVAEEGRRARPEGRIGASPEALAAFAATLGPDDQVVLEATLNTWAIVDLLERHAGRVVVSNPLRTRAIADAKAKTDTIDATTLADLLAADYLPEVWRPDAATRELRRRVRARGALGAERTRLRNRVAAVLARNLVRCPWTDAFGRRGRAWLATVPLPADERESLEAALRLIDAVDAEVAAADAALARAVVDDPAVRRLMTIPGVGVRTAAALVAAIGDVRRFGSPTRLVGYLGLDPVVRQTGGRPAWTGHISRRGPGHLRGLLVEAAHGAIRSPGPLRACHARIAARRGGQVAIVAVARKMAIIAWHLLAEGVDYRWVPLERTAQKLRGLELAAGAPHRRGGHGPGGARERAREALARDRRVLEQAEAAYATLVASRRRPRDAGAVTGERLHRARAEARHGCAAEHDPRASALRHEVTRVPTEDTSADTP